MHIKIRIEKLPKTKEEKDMFFLKMKTYNEEISGKFEKSEIRHMIQILDNAI